MGTRAQTRSWLKQHQSDPQVKQAMAAGWRSRAACKLVEIDDSLRILRGARSILDVGAAPGGWLQVVVQRAAAGTTIVGVDLLPIEPVAGAHILQGDIGDVAVQNAITKVLGERLDLVLCDVAPNLSGVRDRDIALCEQLHEQVFGLCAARKASRLLIKSFTGPVLEAAMACAKRCFAKIRVLQLTATRKRSSEVYLDCKTGLTLIQSKDKAHPSRG